MCRLSKMFSEKGVYIFYTETFDKLMTTLLLNDTRMCTHPNAILNIILDTQLWIHTFMDDMNKLLSELNVFTN